MEKPKGLEEYNTAAKDRHKAKVNAILAQIEACDITDEAIERAITYAEIIVNKSNSATTSPYFNIVQRMVVVEDPDHESIRIQILNDNKTAEIEIYVSYKEAQFDYITWDNGKYYQGGRIIKVLSAII